MVEGKMLIWDAEDKDSALHEVKMDHRDWEILRDVLEAHKEHLEDLEHDSMLDDYDELFRVGGMLDFIYSSNKED